jgi:hypothetical protein
MRERLIYFLYWLIDSEVALGKLENVINYMPIPSKRDGEIYKKAEALALKLMPNKEEKSKQPKDLSKLEDLPKLFKTPEDFEECVKDAAKQVKDENEDNKTQKASFTFSADSMLKPYKGEAGKDIEYAQDVLRLTKDAVDTSGEEPKIEVRNNAEWCKNNISYATEKIEEIKTLFPDETIREVSNILQKEIRKVPEKKLFNANGDEISKTEHEQKQSKLVEVEKRIAELIAELNDLVRCESGPKREEVKTTYEKLDSYRKQRAEILGD